MIATVTEVLQSAMTVRDLMDELKYCDPDAAVLFACNYGDYHNTEQALPVSDVTCDLTEEDLYESAYSRSGIALTDEMIRVEELREEAARIRRPNNANDSPENIDDDDGPSVVVIR